MEHAHREDAAPRPRSMSAAAAGLFFVWSKLERTPVAIRMRLALCSARGLDGERPDMQAWLVATQRSQREEPLPEERPEFCHQFAISRSFFISIGGPQAQRDSL